MTYAPVVAFSPHAEQAVPPSLPLLIDLAGTMRGAEVLLVVLTIGLAVALLVEYRRYRRTRDALYESRRAAEAERERLVNVTDIVSEGVLLHRDGIPLEFNPAFERMIGYSAAEVIGKNALGMLFDDEGRAEIRKRMGDRDENPYTVEAIHRDGSRVPMRIQARELEGGLRVVLARDLRESMRTEREAVERQRRIRALYDLTAGGADAPIQERIERALRYAAQLLGMDSGFASHIRGDVYTVVAAHTPDGSAHPDDTYPIDQTYCGLLVEEKRDVLSINRMATSPYNDRLCYKMAGLESYIGARLKVDGVVSGTLCFASSGERAEPFSELDRETVCLLADWVGDLLLREQADHALLESERKFRLMAENTTDLVALHNADGTFRWVSPSAKHVLGYAPSELVGKIAEALLISDEEDAQASEKRMAQLGSGESLTLVQQVRHKTGRRSGWRPSLRPSSTEKASYTNCTPSPET